MADDPFANLLSDCVAHQMIYRAGMEARDAIDDARRRSWAIRLRVIAESVKTRWNAEMGSALDALADDIEGKP